jgi:two-component system sensor histidine kinase UhpB
LSLLLIEDNHADRRLVREMVADAGLTSVVITECERLAQAQHLLAEQSTDCVLLDLNLPDATGIEAVGRIRDSVPQVPMVVLSGLTDETTAITALSHGAQDYLLKGESDGRAILRAVRYAIERQRAEASRREAEDIARQLAAIVASSSDAIISTSLDGTIRSWNAGAESLYGYSADEAIDRPIATMVPIPGRAEFEAVLRQIAANTHVDQYETTQLHRDGASIIVSLSVSPILDDHGHVQAASMIARDVTAQRATEDALRESDRHRRAILAHMLQAEETERSRIATELHDDTVQVMTATLMTLDRLAMIVRKGDYGRIDDAVSLARATLEEATERARRLMFELRPAILHEHGLTEAIRVLAQQTARETAAEVTITGGLVRHDYTTEELVYRSAREAMANIRKHASPTRISVTLSELAETLAVEITDNGRGFDVETTRRRAESAFHLGIDSLVERVSAAGGSVLIDSAPSAGTRVQITVPISAAGSPTQPDAHGFAPTANH